jgi:hypothetical protein
MTNLDEFTFTATELHPAPDIGTAAAKADPIRARFKRAIP